MRKIIACKDLWTVIVKGPAFGSDEFDRAIK